MTAPNGPILFNSITGDDAAASGCGPSVVVTETITTVSATNSATVTSGSGYSVGDLMYIPSATGRKFNVIATISGTTITFDDNWDDSLTSVSAYIGGKRATWDNADSRLLFSDGLGATIETETDQTINSIIYLGTNAGNLVRGSDGSQVITGTHNDAHFWGKNIVIADMTFATTNSTNTATAAYKNYNGNNSMHAMNLTIDGLAHGAYSNATNCYHFWSRCKATNLSGYAINRSVGNMYASMYRCYVNNALGAAYWGNGTNIGCTLTDNLFANCTGDVLYANNASSRTEIRGNIFVNAAGDCIDFDFGNFAGYVSYNVFASNAGYAINSTVDPSSSPAVHSNAYYNNTAGNTSTGRIESSAIALTADPFVDAAGGDFNLNATNGGGAVLRSTSINLGS